MIERRAQFIRNTNETTISTELNLDGSRNIHVSTGIGFLDHLITSLAFHAGFDLKMDCHGDLTIDDHHTTEDCAIVLGTTMDQALKDRSLIQRFGSAYAPLDEALARAVVDFSGRPHAAIDLQLTPRLIGNLATENITHFLQSLAISARMALHVDVLKGANDHHKAEASFKALALALRGAITTSKDSSIPSTKGVLT